MGREPRAFTVWGRITPVSASQFVVTITAMTTDRIGQDELLGETATFPTLQEARTQRLEMLRAVCARLEAQGNRVSNVELGE